MKIFLTIVTIVIFLLIFLDSSNIYFKGKDFLDKDRMFWGKVLMIVDAIVFGIILLCIWL